MNQQQSNIFEFSEIKNILDDVVKETDKKQELFTVLFVHLTGIRKINSGLGYEFGDDAYNIAVSKIAETIPDCDIVGKISSDELLILSKDCNSPSCAIKGSRGAISVLQEDVEFNEVPCALEPVAGISIFPFDGGSGGELIRHASLASQGARPYEAPYYSFYSAELGRNASEEFEMQQSVRKAISQKQFELHYQPKVSAANFLLKGSEALLRWRTEGNDFRLPGEFLSTAERGGLMVPLGQYVLNQACQQIKDWIDLGFTDVSVSVNVSPQQFMKPNWFIKVREALEQNKVPSTALTIEITEDCALFDKKDAYLQINELRDMGVRISIDDFGTGHSSLAYLSSIPADEVKIDRMFVQSADTNRTNADICKTIVKLAHDLNMNVVAEGIETEDQAMWFREIGVDTLQGFHFSKAIEPDVLQPWLKTGSKPVNNNQITSAA